MKKKTRRVIKTVPIELNMHKSCTVNLTNLIGPGKKIISFWSSGLTRVQREALCLFSMVMVPQLVTGKVCIGSTKLFIFFGYGNRHLNMLIRKYFKHARKSQSYCIKYMYMYQITYRELDIIFCILFQHEVSFDFKKKPFKSKKHFITHHSGTRIVFDS